MARLDRATNVRHDRRVADPCQTCLGGGALLPTPRGLLVAALTVCPNRRAWRSLGVDPCPSCEQTGIDLGRPPRRRGEG